MTTPEELSAGQDPSLSAAPLAEWRLAADAAVYEHLRLVAAGSSLLFAVLAIAYLLFTPRETAPGLALLAAGSGLLAGGLYLYLGRKTLPLTWAHPAGVLLLLVVWLNSVVQMYVASDLHFTINLVFVMIGAGFFLLNPNWFALVALVTWFSWGILVWLLPEPANWQFFGLALAAGTLLAAGIHSERIKTLRSLNMLRAQNQHQKTELQTVLSSTEEAQRSLATSMAVGQRVTSILDLDTLLNQVSILIQQRFNLYAVGIYLLEDDSQHLYLHAAVGSLGRPGLPVAQPPLTLPAPPKTGVPDWVAARRRPLLIDDVSADERCTPDADLPETRSELALPLEFGAQLLGVLDLKSTHLAGFHEDNVPFMQLLADQVAIAINNAVLYQAEKTRRGLTENLFRVGRALSGTLDPGEVLDLILKHLAEIVPYDRAAVMLVKDSLLHIDAQRGFPLGWVNAPLHIRSSALCQEIFLSQQPYAVPDCEAALGPEERQYWNQVEAAARVRAWLGVPLVHLNQVFGIVCLIRVSPQPFVKNEVTLAETFASQAAIAIRNANLYDQITRFNQDLEGLVQQRTLDLQKTYAQLERLDKAKSDFVEMASHELRTPLTVVQGYSQMLLDEPLIKNDARHILLVNGILSGVHRLLEIIESLLDVAKIDNRVLALYPTPIPIQALIQSIYDKLVQEASERRIHISQNLAGLPPIQADVDGLRKVFYHVIVNAIKFTPDGGSVSISGRIVETGYQGLPCPGIEIVVQDTGIGIDPQHHELIFYKFFSTEKVSLHSSGKTKFKGKGTGLGLSIAKGIVDAHRGKIWVESSGYNEQDCPGSQFHILLPQHQ